MHSKNTEARLYSLDILRGLAALAVALFHFSGHGYLGNASPASWAFKWGYLGVDIFFVISGFIIPHALYESGGELKKAPEFLLRRLIRLYPAYAATCILVLVLWFGSSLMPGFQGVPPHCSESQVVCHILFACDFLKLPWFNPVFWTLAIEVQYYLLVCLALPLLTGSRLTTRILAIIGWLSLGVLELGGSTVFSYCLVFGFGILLFMEGKKLLPKSIAWPLIALAVAAQAYFHDWPSAGAGLLAVLWIQCAKTFKFRPMVWLGTISYSLYLIHVPVGGRIINFFARSANTNIRLLGFICACTISILGAYLFYLTIEKPSHNWARRLWRRDSTQKPSV